MVSDTIYLKMKIYSLKNAEEVKVINPKTPKLRKENNPGRPAIN